MPCVIGPTDLCRNQSIPFDYSSRTLHHYPLEKAMKNLPHTRISSASRCPHRHRKQVARKTQRHQRCTRLRDRSAYPACHHENSDYSRTPRRGYARLESDAPSSLNNRLLPKAFSLKIIKFTPRWWLRLPYHLAMTGMVIAVGAMAMKDWHIAMVATSPAATYYLVLSLADRYRKK